MGKYKFCSICLGRKPTSQFYKCKSWKDGYYPYCKECTKDVRKKAYRRNKDKIKTRCKKWYQQNSEKVWRQRLIYKYGITSEWYEQTLNEQNQCCAICGAKAFERRMAVDHCHKKGNLRGILCANCNVLLGLAGDDIELLEQAVNYLKRFQRVKRNN